MVFPVGPGNAYPTQDGGQSILHATAVIEAASDYPSMRMWAIPTGTPHPATPTGPNGYNGSRIPQRTIAGSCNFSCNTPVPYPPQNGGGCPDMACSITSTDRLLHSWTPVSPSTVKQISGVCYLTALEVKKSHTAGRPIGLIAAYIGGTPVEAYANDMHLQDSCKIRNNPPAGGSNVPCKPGSGNACAGRLYNELIAPLVGWNLRAALW